MGEIREFKQRHSVRCCCCKEGKTLEEDRWRTHFSRDFEVMFDQDDKITDRLWYRGSYNAHKIIEWHRYEEDGWWVMKIGERKVVVKRYVWRYLKKWYCPDCSHRMPKVEEAEGLLRLFSLRKVLEFKRDVLTAHEAAL